MLMENYCREKNEKINLTDLMIRLSTLRGRLLNLQKKHAASTSATEKQEIKEMYDTTKKEFDKLNYKYESLKSKTAITKPKLSPIGSDERQLRLRLRLRPSSHDDRARRGAGLYRE